MRVRNILWPFAVLCLATGAPAVAATQPKKIADLPDWSGVWARAGTNVFDPATATPGGAGAPGVRSYPPYNAQWEAKYLENIAKVEADTFPDPLTYCGIPAGFPRLMSLPDTYQFVLRPEAVWILTEHGPNTLRIYTDGRGHPPADEVWTTYTGDSVGHWEGDALVFDTIALRGDGGAIIDRTGVVISNDAHVVTRMRKIDDKTLEAQLVITDKTAFTKPWNVVRRYRKLPAGTRVYDYACGENNRNPVSASGKTLTLGADGKQIDKDR